LIIYEIIWKQKFVDKLLMKHRVSIQEVEEALANTPVYSQSRQRPHQRGKCIRRLFANS